MSELIFEPEVAVEAQSEEHLWKAPAEPGALAVSADDFSALEERIKRAVELVKRERQARAEAEERAAKAEEKLRAQAPVVEQLQSELSALRAERDQVRQRVERLLTQLDALEL
jgi:septal ring factor EnvC (AmiA/AmiB activator)